MPSVNELHIDFLRLLDSTERLIADGEPSADGSWENWLRFCQFISSLDGLQSQLLARLSETNAISAEDIDRYGRRLETLRRRREDLSSAAAAAVTSNDGTSPDADVSPTVPEERVAFATPESPSEKQEFHHTERGGVYGMTSREQSQRRDAGKGLFGPRSSRKRVPSRRREWGGGRGDRFGETNGNEAEADQVAAEISSMAGRLKESSIAINKTLRAQTQVLEDTGDAATSNVDRARRETERVRERLRKKRAAMCASWCMMIMVVATFLATYVLVILPFDKRRGPFVRPRHKSVADAVKQSPNISTQELQRFASQNATRREQAIIESIVEYRERSGRSLAKETDESDLDEGETSQEEVLQSPKAIPTSQDAFDGSTKVAEMSEMSELEPDNIVLESGADSVGQASPLLAIAPEVEEAKEPVCTDPEGAKSCAARIAEPNDAGIEDNGETIEGNQQPVDAAEPMRSKPHVGGQMEERETIDMEAFEERGGERLSMNQLPVAEHPQEITVQREVVLESDAETEEEDGVERSGEGGEDDIVHDDIHPPQSSSQHQYAEEQPQTEESADSASSNLHVDTAGRFPLEDRGVSDKDNNLEAVRRRLRESLGKRREGGNNGQGDRPDEL